MLKSKGTHCSIGIFGSPLKTLCGPLWVLFVNKILIMLLDMVKSK